MKTPNSTLSSRFAFTLVELLVSMAVLTLLIVLVTQLVNSATTVTTTSRKHMDADSHARQIFDRMAVDIAKMVKRPDVDYLFAKLSGGSSSGENDKMFFYSESPAYWDAGSSSFVQRNSVALLGYRINAGYQFERLGKLLSWDGASPSVNGGAAPGGIIFLTSSAAFNPLPATTLPGNWPSTIGDPPSYNNGLDDDYHVASNQVFRFEYCLQLKDGTFSNIPVMNPVGVKNNLTASVSPTATDDSSSGKLYSTGSRWYDKSNNRAYICANAAPSAAIWNPMGVQDISGLVVSLAILDTTSTKMAATNTVRINGVDTLVPDLTALSAAFPDSTDTNLSSDPPVTMAETWRNKVLSSTFASSTGLPQAVASQVRIYQRCFYLNKN